MFPCKFSKHEIVYWPLFNTFQWPIIAEKSYYKKQCCTCPLIPGNRQTAWWETAGLQMALKDLNTIKLLLLDRKLHSKTTFFKRGKTGETGDSALHGVLGKKTPSNELVGFFKNFSQVLLYAFKFRMQLDLAMTHSNIFLTQGEELHVLLCRMWPEKATESSSFLLGWQFPHMQWFCFQWERYYNFFTLLSST